MCVTKSSSCPPLISPRLRRAAVPAARGRRPSDRLGRPRATRAGTSCPAGALNARPQQAAERPTPGRFPRHVQRGSGARWPPRARTKADAPPRASAPPRPTLAGPPADFQPPRVHAGWDQARSGWDPPFLAARSVAASSASATLARPEAAAVRQSAAADPRSRARRVAPPAVASA